MKSLQPRLAGAVTVSPCPPVLTWTLQAYVALDLPAGAATVGLFLTSILQSTWEDLLAVALAGLAGYVAVLGLPLRRGDIKGKLEKAAASLAEVRGAAS